MSENVLDASALLALLHGEPGTEVVEAALAGAAISAVNLSEVGAKLADEGIAGETFSARISQLSLEVVSFDLEQAYQAASLRPLTRYRQISLGDRACLALAKVLGVPVLTTDRAWEGLDLGVEVQVIR